jgi:hypothetical protein
MLTLNLVQVSRSLSLISTFFAIASIILGLHHSSRHRIALIFYVNDPLRGVRDLCYCGYVCQMVYVVQDVYFENVTRHRSRFFSDMFFPAFYLALPWMLLLWSLIAFAFAITIYHFAYSMSMQIYAFSGIAIVALFTIVLGGSPLFFKNILDPPYFEEEDKAEEDKAEEDKETV